MPATTPIAMPAMAPPPRVSLVSDATALDEGDDVCGAVDEVEVLELTKPLEEVVEVVDAVPERSALMAMGPMPLMETEGTGVDRWLTVLS